MTRQALDRTAGLAARFGLLLAQGLALAIGVGLLAKAWPVLASQGPSVLLDTVLNPSAGRFGLLNHLLGTLAVTALAVTLAAPVSLLAAIYLAEYVRPGPRSVLRFLVDLMAAIPSVVYGVFGVLMVVPAVRALGQALGQPTSGYCLLAAGVVLALMVVPTILAIALEVLLAVPRGLREAALALGATRWEATRLVVVRRARLGLLSAVLLGVTRALGETMAVMMVVGNVACRPDSLFGPAYPLPALVANNYGEMMSVPGYEAGLMLAALLLFAVAAGLAFGAHLVLVPERAEAN